MMAPAYSEAGPDRRKRSRLRLSYPLQLSRLGTECRIDTKTENLSCKGFFCLSGSAFSIGEILDCELRIPSSGADVVGVGDVILRCRAEVVRVEKQPDGAVLGLGCHLLAYSVSAKERIETALSPEDSLAQQLLSESS